MSFSSDSAIDYSVIIPAYNEENFLPATLSDLTRAMDRVKTLSGEIVVADNNSTDNTRAVAERHNVKVVFEEHRQIARARNAGANASSGSFLIFVDADTSVSEQLLRDTLTALSSGICGGGAVIAADGRPDIRVQSTLLLWNTLAKALHWAAGSYVFCLRNAFTEIGGFDEEYYASEEIHFSRALNKWAKKNRSRTEIIEPGVVTSMRKLEWFTAASMLRLLFRIALRPSSLKCKEECWLWYKRPPGL